MSVPFRAEKRLARLKAMPTAELLDRVTVLQEQMDPDALELMQAELAGRGVGPEEIGAHARELRLLVVKGKDGLPATCYVCGRAAVAQIETWHRLLGIVPLFRRQVFLCLDHAPKRSADH
jgi:hypothetical protein